MGASSGNCVLLGVGSCNYVYWLSWLVDAGPNNNDDILGLTGVIPRGAAACGWSGVGANNNNYILVGVGSYVCGPVNLGFNNDGTRLVGANGNNISRGADASSNRFRSVGASFILLNSIPLLYPLGEGQYG